MCSHILGQGVLQECGKHISDSSALVSNALLMCFLMNSRMWEYISDALIYFIHC